MRIANIINRNKRVKEIAKRATKRVESAVIHSVDGNRVNIRLNNSPTLVRHVEVAGDIGAIKPNTEVPILWKDGRPVVLAGQPVAPVAPAAETVVQAAAPAGTSTDISARVIRTSNQAASGDVDTLAAITFDTALYDTSGLWSAEQPTRLTVPSSGMYLISGYVQHGTGAATYSRAHIQLNGTTMISGVRTYSAQAASPTLEGISYALRLSAGDYVELLVGSGRTTAYIADSSPTLSIVRLYE